MHCNTHLEVSEKVNSGFNLSVTSLFPINCGKPSENFSLYK